MNLLTGVLLVVGGFVAGYLLATFVYRNNMKKMTEIVDSVNQIKDNLKVKK